jgi:hypothetical protein
MTFAVEPPQERDQQGLDVDQVQATMEQIYEQLCFEMRKRSQAVHEAGANRARVLVPNVDVESKFWLDIWNIWTTPPTRKLDWMRLGLFTVVRRVSTNS